MWVGVVLLVFVMALGAAFQGLLLGHDPGSSPFLGPPLPPRLVTSGSLSNPTVTANVTNGTVPLAVQFTGSGNGGTPPYNYTWNFSDGNTSFEQNPAHTFTTRGVYPVQLRVRDSLGAENQTTVTITVHGKSPSRLTVDLFVSPTSGSAPFDSNLTARAYGCEGLCQITFLLSNATGGTNVGPDPGPMVANGVNVTQFAYIASAGAWTATASVEDQLGDLGEANATINATLGSGPLSVSVSASPASGSAPLKVALQANVTGGVSPYGIQWSLGDGGNGTGVYVEHTYANPGTYTAWAYVWDSQDHHANRSVQVDVSPSSGPGPLLASLTASPAQGSEPLNVTLNVSAKGGSPPYTLRVCDGLGSCSLQQTGWTGSAEQFAVSYSSAGNYSVSATVTDSTGGQSTATTSVSVRAYVPVAVQGIVSARSGTSPLQVSFTAFLSEGAPPFTIQWSFGDGSYGTSYEGVGTSHVYQNPGVYHPFLTVTDGSGHRQNLTLPAITVAAPSGQTPGTNPVPSISNPLLSWILVAAAAGTGTCAAAVAVWRVGERRLRREGAAILAGLLSDEGPPTGGGEV